MRFSDFATPAKIGHLYAVGLYDTTYTGYFNGNVAFFATAPVSAQTVATTAVVLPSVPTNTSHQFLGYFKAPKSGTFTFYMTSDDGSYLWFGDNALSGFTTGNANVVGGGSNTFAMAAGAYYPLRIQYGNAGGPGSLSVSYSVTGVPQTTDLTGLVYYNAATKGF